MSITLLHGATLPDENTGRLGAPDFTAEGEFHGHPGHTFVLNDGGPDGQIAGTVTTPDGQMLAVSFDCDYMASLRWLMAGVGQMRFQCAEAEGDGTPLCFVGQIAAREWEEFGRILWADGRGHGCVTTELLTGYRVDMQLGDGGLGTGVKGYYTPWASCPMERRRKLPELAAKFGNLIPACLLPQTPAAVVATPKAERRKPVKP